MNNSVSITVTNCAKTWPDGTRALEPVDLHIPAGKILALLGPSGCGKTTLLRIICGLERADAGASVCYGTENVTALPPEARGVGVVFQNYALFPNMSVLENVAYGLRVRGDAAASRTARAMEMLSLVHMDAYAARRISQLSGGQRQRIALARALAIQPRVLLLDEPLTALDAKLREHLRVELSQMLSHLGITTIIVTHDRDEAMILGDRIAVMSAGRIEQVGDAEALYREPSTEFVGEFLGTLCKVRGSLRDGLLAAGEDALRFRPHHAALAPAREGFAKAEVVARFFLGGSVRYELVLDDGQDLTVIEGSDSAFRRGDFVSVMLAKQ